MRLVFLDAAEAELDEAITFYDSREPGLGPSFLAAVEKATEFLLAHPTATTASGILRSKRIARFPYSLWYCLEGDAIVIAAVGHHRRRPGYWRDRL